MGINPTGSQIEKLMEQVSAQSVELPVSWPQVEATQ